MTRSIYSAMVALAAVLALAVGTKVQAGPRTTNGDYKVLAPIHAGNLTIFPVVAATTHDTRDFLTLDEGLRSGEVVITEMGNLQPLMRRRGEIVRPQGGAEVNRLVLVNNSDRPLILLAGEIVTGGKQDRIIGKDRIIPMKSDPIDVSVFCVEPGRWTETEASNGFKPVGGQMAQPAVRAGAMADKNQQKVWSEVGKSQAGMAARVPAPAAAEVQSTSSYATVMSNEEVKGEVDKVAAPIRRDYAAVIRELRNRNAVGVVVAVNGEIIWSDLFASTNLLAKYWPKLVRSYAAEAVVSVRSKAEATGKQAQAFLENMDGTHESVESEPGVFRHAEITGEDFKVFELTSLLPKTGFDVHVAKMAR